MRTVWLLLLTMNVGVLTASGQDQDNAVNALPSNSTKAATDTATDALTDAAVLGSDRDTGIFATNKLVAWCIVPFDAMKRGTEARVEMLERLGIKRVAYDWRPEHVPQFEEEILAYKRAGIEFFAFWSWHESLGPLIEKHGIRPQVWYWCPSPKAESQEEKVRMASESLLPIVEKARSLGLKVALYNHGGWGGKPENLVAVCEYLRAKHAADHVGIVYNLHHAHDEINDFANSFHLMKPYLLCFNLNGMLDPAQFDITKMENKVVPIGSGKRDGEILKVIVESQYNGPIGILGHRPDLDAEIAIQRNLDGLRFLLGEREKR